MPDRDQFFEDLAQAVLDGAEVDWAAAEATAGATGLQHIRHLKLLASVARIHRDVLPGATADAPERWGHLRILERVGAGTSGEVFRAWDERLDREVALKLLPADPTPDHPPSAVIREGQLLAKVRHTNVVTIHGAEQIGDRIGLWMEFVHGRTLEQLLQQGSHFLAAEVIDIGVELCHAVSAVHAAGLLHRDIKTHNVMRADDGRIVLMDFGTGRELDAGTSRDIAGTPLYLAPELFEGKPATVQTDVYSLGVLLYRLATGRYPVSGGSSAELRELHERGERVPAREAMPNGAGLARVIDQAIDPRPEHRTQTASAVGAALLGLQQRHERRKPMLSALLAGIAGALVLAASLASLEWADDRSAIIDSVAVLPFVAASGSDEAERLADGITQTLINGLAQVPGVHVRPRIVRYKNKAMDPRRIGRELDVGAVVTGRVSLRDDRLVIQAELMNVADGTRLWGDQYNLPVSDLSRVVNLIRSTLALALREMPVARGSYKYKNELMASDSPERSLRLHLAVMLSSAGALSEARAILEQVIQESRADPKALGHGVEQFGRVLRRQGQLSAAQNQLEEMLVSGRRPEFYEASALPLLARLHFDQGDLTAAREFADCGVQVGRDLVTLNPTFLAAALDVQARTLLAADETAAARQAIDEADWLDASASFRSAGIDIAMVRALAGRSAAQQALALAGGDFGPDDAADAEGALALAWLKEGNLLEAQRAIARADHRLHVTEDRLLRLSGGIAAARVQAATKEPANLAAARQRLEALIKDATALSAVAIAFDARLALGEIEIAAGDGAAGRARLAALERDAQARGFVAVARKAAAASR